MYKISLFLIFSLFMFSCSDNCADVDCGANGSCDDGTCLCDDWVEGDRCETETRAKFLGAWSSASNCIDANGDPISPNWTLSTTATINEFLVEAPDFLVGFFLTAALSDDNNATIQPFELTTGNITGTVEFISDTRLSIVLNSPGSDTCTFDLSR